MPTIKQLVPMIVAGLVVALAVRYMEKEGVI